MHRRFHHGLSLILAMAVLAPTVHSQERRESFATDLPDVGEPLPDIVILDADGNDFPLSSISDSYTVLVFGCLT